jgi:ribosomal protein S18 acetylase RimI-like enzyme
VEDARLRERRLRTQREFYRLVGRLSDGARVLELDGVTASVVPAARERSVFNSVIYDDTARLLANLDELTHAYEEGGIRAWTVWVPAGDGEAARALSGRGHVLDATPEAMARPLEGGERPNPDRFDWTREGAIADLARINDRAYPFEGDPFTRALSDVTVGDAVAYVARLDDAPAASVLALDNDRDCGIYAVATIPEARGRGLVTALMAHAMVDARERGCLTTSLEATRQGRPVYERLGYRPLGALGMWERRGAQA